MDQASLQGRQHLGLRPLGRVSRNRLQSYAAGYPEPQDLLICELAESDENGEFLTTEEGLPVLTGRSLLINWDQVAYAELIPG